MMGMRKWEIEEDGSLLVDGKPLRGVRSVDFHKDSISVPVLTVAVDCGQAVPENYAGIEIRPEIAELSMRDALRTIKFISILGTDMFERYKLAFENILERIPEDCTDKAGWVLGELTEGI